MGARPHSGCSEKYASVREPTAYTPRQTVKISRRSKRSARLPAQSESSASGRNWASPTHARSSSSPVRAYTSHAMATLCTWMPTVPASRALR